MDIVGYAKNIGSVLATAATLAYISGYLILRARANALGTDPGFTLVDEAYVFAGFRFLLVTLVVLLLLSPFLMLVHVSVVWMTRHLALHWMNLVRWGMVAGLIIVTLWSLKILSISGLLLKPGVTNSNSKLAEAIMGTQPVFGVLLTFGMVFLAALAAYWLKARLANGFDALTGVLCVVTAMLFFMLPIYHGALLADRKVRIPARVPDKLNEFKEPIGIVDHTKEQYTLFGHDGQGTPLLATLKQEDMFGIPVAKVVGLNEFMGLLAENSTASDPASSNQNSGEGGMASKELDVQKGFFKTLINQLHMTFVSIASLGDSVVEAGQLWSVEFDASGTASDSRPIGTMDDLSWPVVGPDGATIYAIQQGKVVKLVNDYQGAEVLDSTPNWIKLLGVDQDGVLLGIVYHDNQARPAAITQSGEVQISPPAQSTEDQAQISYLLQESRSYAGGKALFVDRSERGGRGFDVYFKSGDRSVNLSDCGDDSCGQPSFSANFRRVLFIREPRY